MESSFFVAMVVAQRGQLTDWPTSRGGAPTSRSHEGHAMRCGEGFVMYGGVVKSKF